MSMEPKEPGHTPEIPANRIVHIPLTNVDLVLPFSRRKYAASLVIFPLIIAYALHATGATDYLYKAEGRIRSLNPPEACDEPSEEAFEKVNELLEKPLPPKGKTKLGNDVDNRYQEISLALEARTLEQERTTAKRVFEILDLQAMPTENKTQTKQYLSALNKKLEEYDVKIKLNPGGKEHWPKLTSWTLSYEDKESLSQMVLGINALPKDYVKYSGLKHVRYSKGFTGNFKDTVAAHTRTDNANTVYYHTGNESVIAHEIYHLIDAKQCGGRFMRIDPSFAKINKGDYYTDKEIGENVRQPSILALESIDENGEPKGFDYKEVRFSTFYGMTRPSEDKAEVASAFGWSNWNSEKYMVSSKHFPLLREKYTFLLARLYDEEPEVVDQLLSTYDPSQDFANQN